MTRSKKSLVVGICGGSGSGKTTLVRRLCESFPNDTRVLYQDSYYIDQSAKFKEDGGEVNFDHPESLDFKLLAAQIEELRHQKSVDIPIYDFVTHTRKQECQRMEPAPILLIDGTLILSQENVRELFDHSVFLQVPEHLRFERRRDRDMRERGRQLDGIVRQFYNHVKPMHDEFVEPSKMFADVIASEMREFEKVFQSLKERLNKFLGP